MSQSTQIIYVELLNEGTFVLRPVQAQKISDDIYEISLSNEYDSTLEDWAFLPGDVVFCERKMSNQEMILMAKKISLFQ